MGAHIKAQPLRYVTTDFIGYNECFLGRKSAYSGVLHSKALDFRRVPTVAGASGNRRRMPSSEMLASEMLAFCTTAYRKSFSKVSAMRNLPVHWYEGVFLRPQHFQAADRYWAELLSVSNRFDQTYNYGVFAVDFSREALANHQFELRRLQVRMRDGTIVDLDPSEVPDRVDLTRPVKETALVTASLAEAFEREAVVRIYVAVPKVKLGRANVVAENADADARYLEANAALQDESWGGNEQEIQLRRLNVRLLVSTQDLSGFEIMPIAQIKRAGDGEATPQLDPSFIPPLLSIDAWPGLNREIIRGIYDLIGQKIEVLSNQVINRGIGLDSRDPGDPERILMLSQLNSAYAALSIMAFSPGMHPRTLYIELCRVLGQLSIFGPQRACGRDPTLRSRRPTPDFHDPANAHRSADPCGT